MITMATITDHRRRSGGVGSSSPAFAPRGTRRCARGAAALLGLVAIFQVALAAGAPWGEATQGGRARTVDGVLQGGSRAAAGVSAGLLVVAAWLVLRRAGVVGSRAPGRVVRVAAWVVVCFLGVNMLTNLAGRHPVERYGMTLVSASTLVLAAIVARSEAHVSSRT